MSDADELARALNLSANHGSFDVELTVLGSPEGDVAYSFSCADGSVDAAKQASPDADIVLTLPFASTNQMVAGELEPTVAYMQGLLKVTGNMELFLALLKTTI